jgi:broad specificity phosphatase PhoE
VAEPRTLVLVRHGQTAWNVLDRAQGHTDVQLDDTGQEQASAVAPYLAAMDPVRLWSSDLTRARQTMAYVEELTGLTATPDPRLREYDLGVRSGLTKPEFAERYPERYAAWLEDDDAVRVRGEESTAQVRDRVDLALRECVAALEPGETGIVVMHGAALKVGLVALLGWADTVATTLRGMDNCAWSVVADHPVKDGLRLVSYNEIAGRKPHPPAPLGADFASGEGTG